MSFDTLFDVPGCVFLLVATTAICGCGSDDDELRRATVTGAVSIDGKPLPQGIVRFVPIDGTAGPKTSVVVSEGRFTTDAAHGPVVGRHRIEIESTDTGGFALDDEQALQKLRDSGTRRIDAVRVPAAYNTFSKLAETVALDGPNDFRFDLQSNKRR